MTLFVSFITTASLSYYSPGTAVSLTATQIIIVAHIINNPSFHIHPFCYMITLLFLLFKFLLTKKLSNREN